MLTKVKWHFSSLIFMRLTACPLVSVLSYAAKSLCKQNLEWSKAPHFWELLWYP